MYIAATGRVLRHRLWPILVSVAAPRNRSREEPCGRDRDGTQYRILPLSPTQSSATSRSRCPDRRLPDRYRESLPVAAVELHPAPSADQTDAPPASLRHHASHTVVATPMFEIVAL